jgi:hypothetical protein
MSELCQKCETINTIALENGELKKCQSDMNAPLGIWTLRRDYFD